MSELHQTVFFYVFLTILATAAVFTFLGLAGKLPGMSARNLSIMLTSVILAVVGSVIVYFKALFDETNSEVTKRVISMGQYSDGITKGSTPVEILEAVVKRLADSEKMDRDYQSFDQAKRDRDDFKAKLEESRSQLTSLQERAIPLERLPKEFQRENTIDSLTRMTSFLESYQKNIPSPNLVPQDNLKDLLDAIEQHHSNSLLTLLDIRSRINGLVEKVQPVQGTVSRLTIDSAWSKETVQYTKYFKPFWNTAGAKIVLVYKYPGSDKEQIVRDLVLAPRSTAAFSAQGDYLMVNTSVMQQLLPPDLDATRIGELTDVRFYILPE